MSQKLSNLVTEFLNSAKFLIMFICLEIDFFLAQKCTGCLKRISKHLKNNLHHNYKIIFILKCVNFSNILIIMNCEDLSDYN